MVPATKLQVRTHKPPDHAGVEYDDGNACARTGRSYWVAVYQRESDLASVSIVIYLTESKWLCKLRYFNSFLPIA
jgi:hypothetical protein